MSNGKGSKQKCQVCGMKIRGSNHEKGEKHVKELERKELERKELERKK